jgi:hypothetical protein
MKKLTEWNEIESYMKHLIDNANMLDNSTAFVNKRLQCHDEDIEEIKSNITTVNRLITILFLENIAIILLLIIWSW